MCVGEVKIGYNSVFPKAFEFLGDPHPTTMDPGLRQAPEVGAVSFRERHATRYDHSR